MGGLCSLVKVIECPVYFLLIDSEDVDGGGFAPVAAARVRESMSGQR